MLKSGGRDRQKVASCLSIWSTKYRQVTVIADLEGVDMSVLDRRLLALSKELGKIESENYPEVLKSLGTRDL